MKANKADKQTIVKLNKEVSRLKFKINKYKLALKRKEKRGKEVDG